MGEAGKASPRNAASGLRGPEAKVSGGNAVQRRRGATAARRDGGQRRVWHAARDRRLACASATRVHRPVPSRKRRVVYPPARTSTRQPRPGEPGGPGGPPTEYVRPTVASINLHAGAGRAGLKVGDRVRITGTGLYSGELATIDKMSAGVI